MKYTKKLFWGASGLEVNQILTDHNTDNNRSKTMKSYAITASHKDTGTVYHETIASLNIFDAITLFSQALEEKHLITLDRIDCLNLDLLEE